jgi:hypothetical protein
VSARTRDPIPLPQRLRLLCAAKRVGRVGSDAALSLVQEWFGPILVVSSHGHLTKGQRFVGCPLMRSRRARLLRVLLVA